MQIVEKYYMFDDFNFHELSTIISQDWNVVRL